jgi:HK97 gp10 family phage protein
MNKVTLSTKGFDEYLERISKMDADIDSIVDNALTDAAQIIQDEMVRLVPQPGQSKSGRATGNLKNHIKTELHKEGNVHWIDVGILRSKGSTDAKTARYANVVEYGSSTNQAQSYIRAGIEKSKARARKALRERLKREAGLE